MTADDPIGVNRGAGAKAAVRALPDTELAMVNAEIIDRLGQRYFAHDISTVDSRGTGTALHSMRSAGDLAVRT